MTELFEAEGFPLLLRTDYSDDAAWARVRDVALAPVPLPGSADVELEAELSPVSDPRFDGWDSASVAAADLAWPDYFVVLADAQAMAEDPPTFVVVSVDDEEEPGRAFRTVAAELAAIVANLSLANLDFTDFADNVGDDGVFRGFE